MQRTDYSNDIDGALVNRNAGSQGFSEIARSGNGNMLTDLLADDCRDYKEIEGLGETVEEMSNSESKAEDAGNGGAFQLFREPLPGEHPPFPPEPGKGWLRRRIRMGSRKPGGNRLARVRWVQVSPERYQELLDAGQIKEQSGPVSILQGLGFVDISSGTIKTLAIGAGLAMGLMLFLGGKRKPTIIK